MKTIKRLIALVLLFSTTLFALNVATVTAIKGSAIVDRKGSTLDATLGLGLEQKDTITTKEDSKMQIIFKDNTIISLGKNSSFSIQEYMFNENQKPIAKFGMFKGAMNTITGQIGKVAPEKFSVHTKNATIGIRGTNFTIVLNSDDSYNVFCTYGAISVTIENEVFVIQQGFVLDVSTDGKVEKKELTPENLNNMKKESFGAEQQKSASVIKSGTVTPNTPIRVTNPLPNTPDIVINNISNQIDDTVKVDEIIQIDTINKDLDTKEIEQKAVEEEAAKIAAEEEAARIAEQEAAAQAARDKAHAEWVAYQEAKAAEAAARAAAAAAAAAAASSCGSSCH